ncbi:hypothetical protein NliqN6_5994 [Naganishia liquefaciens]|uniref:Transcription factor CBF/NF-Y/archaeal histone domain-containing protein n=1 Tax=Naganishia liquefaciens TaxID=104408 RepID=A0A8H3YIX0_9TREE|nr:hypothetical protein NliqN6_5994 [Naganishia liquefaciens]
MSSSLAPLAPTYRPGDDAAQLASREAAALAADAAAAIEPNVFTEAQIDEYKEQDRYLPIANVGRIMKAALPDNAKIAKEAKECVQECVSEFISFLSSEAAEKVLNDKRKTINGEDILYGMTALGFDNYAEACKVYLAKYRSRQLNQEPISHRNSLALTSHQPSPDTGSSSPVDDEDRLPTGKAPATGKGKKRGGEDDDEEGVAGGKRRKMQSNQNPARPANGER